MSLEEFESFYNEKFKLVFRFCFKRVGNLQDTEDIVSNTFEAFFKILQNVDTTHASALLFQICKNKLNDYLRHKYRFNFKNSNLEDLEEVISDFETLEQEEKTESNFGHCKTILHDIIKILNSDERALFEQKFIKNLTINQIAIERNISTNYVKVKTNRLVKKLKKIWEKMN